MASKSLAPHHSPLATSPSFCIHSATRPEQRHLRPPLRPQLPPPHRRQALLESTLTSHPGSVDSKPLTPTLSPLSATLTKNAGGGVKSLLGQPTMARLRDLPKEVARHQRLGAQAASTPRSRK